MTRWCIVPLSLLAFAACKGGKGAGGDGGTASPGFMSSLAGLVGFEGEIEMKSTTAYSGSSAMGTMLFSVKKDKMRVEFPGLAGLSSAAGGFSMIILVDATKKKGYWLTPSTKTYFEMPLTGASAAPGAAKSVATKTGKSDKVAGYSCDEWQVVDPVSHYRTVTCVTSGLSFLGLSGSPLKDLTGGSWMDAVGASGFPLRAETFDASGTLQTKLEATRIEKKSEPDSNFEVPPGYKPATGLSIGGGVTATPPSPTR